MEKYYKADDLIKTFENLCDTQSTYGMHDKAIDTGYFIQMLLDYPTVEADIDELKKEVADLNNRRHLIWALGVDYDGCNTVESLKELIDELVSYTQLPREQVPDITSRTGRWVQSEEWAEDYTCSLCGNTAFKDDHGNYNVRTKYCPHCGAKMHKED
jgi:polyhydroxyalkanoate synthesis regulator phasin